MKDNKSLLRVDEFAAILNVRPSCIRRWLLEGKISSTKIGRLVRIPEEEAVRVIQLGYRPAKTTRR